MKPGLSRGAGTVVNFTFFPPSMRVRFPFWVVLPGQCDTHRRKERGAAGNVCAGAGEALPVTRGHRRVIVNIPEMTAIPRRLRLPGGAAGLAGPLGPCMSRTKSGHCSLASSGWPEDRQSCE